MKFSEALAEIERLKEQIATVSASHRMEMTEMREYHKTQLANKDQEIAKLETIQAKFIQIREIVRGY